jgi:hypothetical protein
MEEEERTTVRSRLRHAWNAFVNMDEKITAYGDYSSSYASRPDRIRLYVSNERSIISSIYTRLAIDVAAFEIRHVKIDDQQRYLEDVDSGLNNCLTLEANLDQDSRAFIQDIASTMFNDGVAAVVPVDTSLNPKMTGSYDILTMRCGDIKQWMPEDVKVNLYNQAKGRREEIVVPKKITAIIENPLYAVMNEPNSTLQRLIRKLNLLDSIDDQSASGKLDIIIQLPYALKSESKREQAAQRRSEIEFQLKGSKYGIAYIDGTEKITQLNRPAENNLMVQVEYLMKLLYSQLGLTEDIMNGTADEAAMLNYHNRTIEPILIAITKNMIRKFITKTGRTQGQSIMYFHDPFKLVPLTSMADIIDKTTRNEVMASNEWRQKLGLKPSKDPKADQLRNSNMPQSELGVDPKDPTDRRAVDRSKIPVPSETAKAVETT